MAENTSLQIEILDNIGGWGYSFRDLYGTAKGYSGDNIRVVVNSFGGSVLEGLLIYNYLKGHKAKVETHIPGYAMSMGTVIAAAGDHVTMARNGYFMIHNPWGVGMGDHKDMTDMGDLLLTMTKDLASIYVAKTGLSQEKIMEMMAAETWLTAEEALALGFINEITEGAKFEASADPQLFAQFTNVPASVLGNNSDMNTGKPSDTEKNLLAKFADFLGLSGTTPPATTPDPQAVMVTEMQGLRDQLAGLTAQVADAEASVQAITTERDTLAARVTELEAEAAADDTGGRNDGDPATPAEVKSYHMNPIFLEAKKRAGLQ